MKNKIVALFVFFLSLNTVFASWQDKEMTRINKKVAKIDKAKLLSKDKTVQTSTVRFYYSKKIKLLRITEKKANNETINYYFDAKTGNLLLVNDGSTMFYYQSKAYFAVLSHDNFSKEEAKKRADRHYERAKFLKTQSS
jgi:hypothetical protein